MAYRIVKSRWDTGEHYRILVDEETGLPPAWPALYITTQVRNPGWSVATMEAALGAIQVLLGYTEAHEIDLEERVLKRKFLAVHEVDALCDWAQGVQGKSGNGGKGTAKVSATHLYNRLNRIAAYLEWFARAVLDNRRTPSDDEAIKEMVQSIRKRSGDADSEDDLLLFVTLFRSGFLGLFLIGRGSISHIVPPLSESRCGADWGRRPPW